MRIVIDMQGAQTESRFRGIGRYSMAFAQAVVRNKGNHEVLLALSGSFPHTVEPIRLAFKGLLPSENILIWSVPDRVKEHQTNNESRRKAAELIREAFLISLQPDLIHITSLFEGYVDDGVTSISKFDTVTTTSVTLYDLIPLINADHYLQPNPTYQNYYIGKLEHLKKAKIKLAISAFARQEAIQTLGFNEEEIFTVSTALDECFHPQIVNKDDALKVCRQFAITNQFILYAGGADERKNLPRLIEAYAALPKPLRSSHQLVIAGKILQVDIDYLRHCAKSFELSQQDILFTGYIADEDLIQLYSLCKVFVFPSWHEGFGLPALEAMACGAVVIGSNTSSIPEVIGLDEALFDPFHADSISKKLEQALTDEAFRRKLQDHGSVQATKFSWDQTALAAIAAWTKNTPSHKTIDVKWKDSYDSYTSLYQNLISSLAALSHDFEDEELQHIAASLASNEEQSLKFLRKKELQSKIKWRIEGPFDSSYSLALVNREIAKALDQLGHQVVLHSTEGPGDYKPKQDFLKANPRLNTMYALAGSMTQWDADITSRNLYPPRVVDMTSRLNALHAYGWEESGFPLDWVENFNLHLQGMTLMSNHVQKTMVDHGVSIPTAVSHLGVDHWEHIQPDPAFQIQAKTFKFLHVSSCFPRKGADVMLRSYGKSFRSSDDVTLIVKTFPNPHNEIYRWLADASRDDPNFPDVQIIESDLTDAQLKSLYLQCDALVAPSRAEGFGLPMAEAMLSGLAVITTGWSGQTDFCTPQTAWLVDFDFERAKTHFGIGASVWAEPKEGHLAQLMREVFEADEHQRHAKIEAGRSLLLSKFRWSQTAQRMVDEARQWANQTQLPKPKVGWVSTWNSKCGIAAYSEHLVSNMTSEVTVFADDSMTVQPEYGNRVIRCWSQRGDDNLANLTRAIQEKSIDILVVQFNYGFFNFESFQTFISEQLKAGRKVLITLHATSDPLHVPHKKLVSLASVFAGCHRLLVHSPKDLNQLKDIGVVHNTALFPHGVINFPGASQPQSRVSPSVVLASYGFFLPHKGLIELIQALGLLRNKGIRIQLEMINAEYPDPVSHRLIEQAKKEVAQLGLKAYVNLVTDYLDDNDSLKKLSQADLVVFPYQKTGESSSAAVRHGLACGCPVAVTPLAIFEDVDGAVYKLPGTSPAEIASGIESILNEIQNTSQLAVKTSDMANTWRRQHDYSKLGYRLSEMLTALTR